MIADRCLERDQLKRYLGGWTAESDSAIVEEHLAQCDSCERTINQLESETQIELPTLGTLPGPSANPASDNSPDTDSQPDSKSSVEPNQRLQKTIDSIKRWNPAQPAHSNSTGVAARTTEAKKPIGDFGNYELGELVGRGGMAEVYRARHKRLQRDVALKLIRVPRWHMAESLSRIEREMAAVGRLKHPAIVSAMDAGEHDGVQFLVTEFIEGLDVAKIARATGPLGIADACEIVRTAALGLDHAHAHGIIHRDMKPSNLMLDINGNVKILDFGLVHLEGWTGMAAEVTTVGQLLGTLDYMAPEQADRAECVNHRSDVYSLGATLFRLLCGRAPYAASSNQSPLEKLRLLANERPPRIATLRPDLPAELAACIDRTLDRDPAHRPASAAHLAEALDPFTADADLVGLVERALRQSPSVNSPASLETPSLVRLANPEWAIPATATQASGAGKGRRRWRILAGLAFFFAAIAAGIVIILEMQKGRIIIETDSANINVELLADGRSYKEMELVPGENQTRVFAGRYEIRINDGTDRYVIDNNAFVLKRGETVVAKIRVDESTKNADVAVTEKGNSEESFYPSSASSDTDPQPGTTTGERTSRTVKVYANVSDPKFVRGLLTAILNSDRETRISALKEQNQLVIYTTSANHQLTENILARMNSTPEADAPSVLGQRGELLLKSYLVTGDPSIVTGVVSGLLQGKQNVRMVFEDSSHKLFICATAEHHALVEDIWRKFNTAPSAATSGNKILQTPVAESIPVYEGKFLDDWLHVLESETSDDILKNAEKAVISLAKSRPELLEQVRARMLAKIEAGEQLTLAFRVIRELGLSETHVEQLLPLISKASPANVPRLLEAIARNITRANNDSKADLARFREALELVTARPDWGADDLNDLHVREPIVVAIAGRLYETRNNATDMEATNHKTLAEFVEFLLTHPKLGPNAIELSRVATLGQFFPHHKESPQEVQARQFARSIIITYDKDHDGKLSKDELQVMRRRPAGIDQNNDGYVTLDELITVYKPALSQSNSSLASRSSSATREMGKMYHSPIADAVLKAAIIQIAMNQDHSRSDHIQVQMIVDAANNPELIVNRHALVLTIDESLRTFAANPEQLFSVNAAYSKTGEDGKKYDGVSLMGTAEGDKTFDGVSFLGIPNVMTQQVLIACNSNGKKADGLQSRWMGTSYYRPANPALELINLMFQIASVGGESIEIPTDGLKAILAATEQHEGAFVKKLEVDQLEDGELEIRFDTGGFTASIHPQNVPDGAGDKSDGTRPVLAKKLDVESTTILAHLLHQAAGRASTTANR